MDSQNLATASLYINNLLLSRGLLRNGTLIEFAKPSLAEGGKDATKAKIMNLVHDMVLRRDRETDTLSTLSTNLETLRIANAQQSQSISRLQARNADLERQLTLSKSHERTAKAALRTSETRNRALREDMGRLKLIVTQARAQCANDIRKRDNEINRLKKHLEGRRGREGTGGQLGVVVITPTMNKYFKSSRDLSSDTDVESPDYSLAQETTEFLTLLSQSLSNENDALIGLIRNTLATLRTLQGLPPGLMDSPNAVLKGDSGVIDDPNVVMTPPPSYESLSSSTDEVLEQLRVLLTSPSFVPMEEVAIREDEIVRLREGWEKMEARWREAVTLMDSWRKRMMETGETLNLEDVRKGLSLGSDISVEGSKEYGELSVVEDSPEQTQHDHDQSFASEMSAASSNSKGTSEAVHEAQNTNKEANSESFGGHELGVALFPVPKVLRPTAGNVRRPSSPSKISPKPGPEGNLDNLSILGDCDETSLLNFANISSCRTKPSKNRASVSFRDNKQTKEGECSPTTVQQKLKKVQAEADETRKRTENFAVGEEKRVPRKATTSRRSRRKSTLSPEELEDLMGIF